MKVATFSGTSREREVYERAVLRVRHLALLIRSHKIIRPTFGLNVVRGGGWWARWVA